MQGTILWSALLNVSSNYVPTSPVIWTDGTVLVQNGATVTRFTYFLQPLSNWVIAPNQVLAFITSMVLTPTGLLLVGTIDNMLYSISVI